MHLLTSAQANFVFKETYVDATTLAGSKTVKGCRICLITLECGEQLTAKVPPVKLDLELPKPMANFFSLLPTVDELSCYNKKVEANMKLLKYVNFELQAQLQYSCKRNIQQIAVPIAKKLTMREPSFEKKKKKKFNEYILWKSRLVVRNAGFILSALLHLGLMIALYRYRNLCKFQPFSHKLDEQKIPPTEYGGRRTTLESCAKLHIFPMAQSKSITARISTDGKNSRIKCTYICTPQPTNAPSLRKANLHASMDNNSDN